MFYCLRDVFEQQAELNTILSDVVTFIGCPRYCLNIFASPRGLIVGCIKIQEDGNWIDCENVGFGGKIISGDPFSITEFTSNARYIIVVEKEAIFWRLAQDELYKTIPSIIITAKGYPDLATRVLLHRLQNQLNIPCLGLFDWDPFGVSILLVYKLGSAQSDLAPIGNILLVIH
eukprot:TRINITY_DN720_c0_g1_i11.p1 TRINITY_DN720_c0_g1~~TRINITY_DN720_c0_g1_i11.p1  ORF type:complete len:174 (+),score=3.63 TRINITY_DN720_c0_g1_i11:306-827(+)